MGGVFLKKEHDQYKILDKIPGFAYLQAPDYSIVYANSTFREFFCEPGDRHCYEVVMELDRPCENCNTMEILKSKGSGKTELKTPSGRIYTLFKEYFVDEKGQELILNIGIDITERRKAEEKLEEKRSRLENIIEGTNAGTWEWNVQTGETVFNERWAEIIGYTLDELSPTSIKTWEEFAHPDDLNRSEEILNKHFSGEIPYYDCEARMKHRDGHWVWVLDRGRVVSWTEDGKPRMMFGTHTDITAIKEAESIMQRTQFAFENSPDEIYFVDRKGRIVYANLSSRKSFGIEQDVIASGKTVFDINPEMTSDRWEKLWSEILEKGHTRFESVHRRYDGIIYPIDILKYHISYENNDYSCTIAHDISDRKKAEEALLESEEKYRMLVELAGEGVWKIDTDGKTTFVNKSMAKILGYTVDEMTGRNLFDFMDETGVNLAKINIERRKSGISEQHDFEFIRKDGKRVYTSLETTPIFDREGNYTGALAVVADITQRHIAENSLKEVNKKLNLLSSITRHDILNQITGAAGYIQLLEMNKEIPSGSKEAEYIKKISGAVDTIKKQILFTRDYKDMGEQAPEWFDLGGIINKAYENVAFENIELKNDLKSIEIFADPLLEKVIYNLIDNAVKHGEKITRISFSAEEMADGLVITCEDDGIGIPDEVKEKIFRREYYKNSGLGLFISREILGITGLSIKEKGKFGEGARFEILVPEGKYRFTG